MQRAGEGTIDGVGHGEPAMEWWRGGSTDGRSRQRMAPVSVDLKKPASDGWVTTKSEAEAAVGAAPVWGRAMLRLGCGGARVTS